MLDGIVESGCCFAVTYLVLRQYAKERAGLRILTLATAILAGRLLFELPLVLIPHNGIQPLIITLLAASGTAFAVLNHCLRDKTVLIMTILTMLLLATLGYAAWIKML